MGLNEIQSGLCLLRERWPDVMEMPGAGACGNSGFNCIERKSGNLDSGAFASEVLNGTREGKWVIRRVDIFRKCGRD